ncbi:hypothetical protein AGABI1DRAFT_79084 [Agaricus bisporus var. burnettii JB137-S8]|uniref:GST N-terminal domain-containing protein n=1 Tax=Agaricus bisporus var. burnettii (strain JB137-S8 / ATCC MYA-4627 / FGSC 10392) TaxID=597362 RepID=K5WLF0_AGABU|nr:uncharacterized protein AGABI1DRAFT_79084 [Agaricus bisporus var. burnettii JB137-S8]EKM76096.1 hypothetical protein AGABI1DRAFT_79084 [Agaricus bisporus var. burnettii JB137-S8]
MLVFYDLAAKEPIKTWSPNTWKTRYVLNFKKIPYKTIYLEFPELKGVLQKAGAQPLVSEKHGMVFYTSPAIVDNETEPAISDSFKIAEYLDKRYPDTPKAFPLGSEALQAAFHDQFFKHLFSFAPFIVGKVPNVLNQVSSDYYRDTREKMFGKPFEEIYPVGEDLVKDLAQAEEFFDTLNGWYSESRGPYFMGDNPSFADFVVGGFLLSLKIIHGEDSAEWKSITTWSNGRWQKLLMDLEKYACTES